MRIPRKTLLLTVIFTATLIALYSLLSPAPNPGLTTTIANQGPLFDPLLFRPGTPSPNTNHTLTIVTGHLPTEDISWLTTALLSPYITLSIHPITPNTSRGHEASIYLSYILKHYPHIPSTVTLFLHPHARSWHNNILHDISTLTIISRLSLSHVLRQGYFNTRCHLDPGCPRWLKIDQPWYEWDLKYKPEEPYLTDSEFHELHGQSTPIPNAISQPCCAQFAVSRERILARPRDFYQRYYDWLQSTSLEDSTSGRLMEYSWQYLFTGLFEHCPSQHQCYCDGYGICFEGKEAGLQRWLDVLRTKERVDEELATLWKKGKVVTERYGVLVAETNRIGGVLGEMKEEALRRGRDPELRATECGREWREGDGF